MKQILGVIVHLIGYVVLLGMFAIALISVVFEKLALCLKNQYTRTESNRDQRNRNPLFYPLNYGCMCCQMRCKGTKKK